MPLSDTLENAGRSVTSLFSGGAAGQASAAAQRERGNSLVKNMGTGGLMLGGGAAALVAAYNLLSSLNKEREMDDDSRLDDDSLYISDPRQTKAAADGVSPLLAPGLAATAAVVGTGAGYALVQKIWNSAEKRRRNALLDEAQRDTIAAADNEFAKTAAAKDPKFNLADALTATPVALPLLAMLATGGLTYAALDKSFPTIGRTKRTGPKRIRVASKPYSLPEEDAATEEESVDLDKQAAASDLRDAGDEFLASIVAAARPNTITGDFIAKAASGGVEEMETLLSAAGSAAVIASIKGATKSASSAERRMLGTMALFKSAALRDTVKAVAVAEYLENFSDSFNAISGCPATMRKMATMGCLLGVIARDHALPELSKQAAMMAPGNPPGILERLKAMLTVGGMAPPQADPLAAPSDDALDRDDRDAALNSDAGGGVGGLSEDGTGGNASESTGDNDVIDDVLAPGGRQSSILPSG